MKLEQKRDQFKKAERRINERAEQRINEFENSRLEKARNQQLMLEQEERERYCIIQLHLAMRKITRYLCID